ncbi:MAG: glycosyltransferase [Deltaproteobacteria bacterium]|nr:glycosyltransferase [Deltaproteobacteria bacterium]
MWDQPYLSDYFLGGYLGLLTVLWGALVHGVPSWGRRWSVSRPALGAPVAGSNLLVSICIPARNEAENIGDCVRAALLTQWPNFEVIVVDDRSSDDTALEATAAADGDQRVYVVQGVEPPLGWAGKPWACARAAGEARGQLLAFVDADVRLAPEAIAALVPQMIERDVRLISAYGSWDLHGLWERALIPAIGWLIRGAVDIDGVNDPGNPVAFANGQFILVERPTYESMNGHGCVKDQILEDVRLAEQFKRRGHGVAMVVAPWAFSVRLYDSLGAIVSGYSKNLYEGMGRRPSLALGATLFICVGALLPWAGLALGCVARWAWGWGVPSTVSLSWFAVVCALQLLFRYRLEVRDGRSGWIAWAHPIANVVLVWILLRSMFGVKATWKGRTYVDGRAQV